MRITEGKLRQIIRTILNEDLTGFRKRTDHIRYGARGSEWNPDTTFINEPDNRILARDVKRAWSAEADHDFMSSLTKVHWIVYPEQAETFMGLSGRNEISVKGYLPGAKLDTPLGGVGFIVQGRVTLAANSQDTIYSGMSGDLPPETHKRFAPSGTPKRARNFNNWISANYMLDRQSFMPEDHNELIVDNWKIISIVIDMSRVLSSFTGGGRYDWTPAMGPIIESGFPLYDMDMKPVSPDMILQAMKDAEGKPKKYDFAQQVYDGLDEQLRGIIRDEILCEARITPDNLPDDIALRLRVTANGKMIIVRATRDGDDLGWVEAHTSRGPRGTNFDRSPCRDAYEVVNSGAYRRGLGPLLYDIAMEAATVLGGGLMADRFAVSDDAQRVWKKYQEDRPDVTYLKLDSEENEKTPPFEDNCNVLNAKAHAGDDWYDHPLAGVYRKPGMETIRRLVRMKRLQVDGMDI